MDLHRHDECSSFDGYGKASELAKLAKELGHTALGISNHGNTNGLVQHYLACKENGIKPVLGCEGYFLPKYKEQHRGYHLCLFAKNKVGYHNLNALQYEGEKQKYYNPIWTFELLEKYHEGLICTSACIAGYLSQCLKEDKLSQAEKYIKKMVEIFGDDFYIEIQPYKISEPNLQEMVNVKAIKLARKLKVKCVLTSDSHRGRKEDFPTYLKMHEVAGHDLNHIEETYKERYMPSDSELYKRFVKMHKKDFKESTESIGKRMILNLKEIEDKCVEDIFKDYEEILPKYSDDSEKLLKSKIKKGLEEKGKWNKKYQERVKQEFNVIKTLGFHDYFLIVADYVNWAKEHGINVGPGRGSACNCLIAYALGITEVDSLLFGLDFRRFLREDKKKLPDIDIDFETSRRHEVIDYVINKYKGHTARIASYGLYKVDNLINDLAKVCGLPTDKSIDETEVRNNKKEIADIKKLCNKYIDEDGKLDKESLLCSREAKLYNSQYDDIITHFTKLYFKMRFIGTHAAGVAVTGGDILDYTALRIDKNGNIYTNYDLNDMENIGVVKFDMLGLGTMEELGELKGVTGSNPIYDEIVVDEKIIDNFNKGNTIGVFQFDKKAVRDILIKINCNCFDDIIAANAMNRPGPLSLHMPEAYAENKINIDEAKQSLYYDYTKESYGTVIYQEQIQQICVYIGGMSWGDADKVMKMIGGQSQSEDAKAEFERNKKELHDKFVKGAIKNGLTKQQAEEMFNTMLVYSFNKGHACGYSLISVKEMYYKTYFPTEFWFAKIKYAPNEDDYDKFCSYATKDGCVVFLPHINYSNERMRIRKVEGENCLQRGLSEIKGVGEKAAKEIVEERKRNGIFTSYDNFYDRCKSRVVNEKVIRLIKEYGASEFDKNIYIKRVTKYNSSLIGRDFK
ncbi:MAG: DNA polymerase III subunit alpha [Methanobrevibacter sp.]|nr:DNA polymerase III subunit alpha [Methanobrevibacter sp.]